MNDQQFFQKVTSIVENALKQGRRKFVIYPYGYNGFRIENILKQRYGLDCMIVDNNLSKVNPRIKCMNDLEDKDFPVGTVLIFSLENPVLFDVVYHAIPEFIPRECIFFVFEGIATGAVKRSRLEDFEYMKCTIGRHTTGWENIISRPGLCKSIGRFCAINGTACIVSNHPLDMVSVSSSFYTPPYSDSEAELDGADDQLFVKREFLCKKFGKYDYNGDFNVPLGSYLADNTPCIIGNDVWIGRNVVIMPGLRIGDGAVLAAGAVVTHDVAPYTIVGGVPARPIKRRFSDEMIASLLSIKWWEWDDGKIKENYDLFYQPEAFVKKFGN